MNASERTKCIIKISEILGQEEWPIIDLTLKQFKIKITNEWIGNRESYIIEMIGEEPDSAESDSKIINLAKHLNIINDISSDRIPSFWKESEPRLFISHVDKIKDNITKLAGNLRGFGFSTFVAHVDIEPTKEWQNEIELALLTMDVMVALISPDFICSKWCDQEIGYAIGRKIPIIPVKLGQDPYGFIGKYQALQGNGRSVSDIANDIFSVLLDKKTISSKIIDVHIDKLKKATSFNESKEIIRKIEKFKFINKKHLDEIKNAAEQNNQVSDSREVSRIISNIEKRFER